MSDEKKIEGLLEGQRLDPGQWYAVRASAFVRKTAGRTEVKALKVNTVQVDSPDAPMPPEGGEAPEPTPQ